MFPKNYVLLRLILRSCLSFVAFVGPECNSKQVVI